ncbi:MAG: sarcosine oxidase subunit gamma [Betaproteobacteria bacterium]|nr:sarcosine oxidase subunit gamma [Betaproteobacteria bacterium]
MADSVTLALEPALPAAAQWHAEGVAITPLGPSARWSLRLPEAAAERLQRVAGFRIAMEINRSTCENDKLATRLGPDEWLLCAPQNAAAELERLLTAALNGAPHALVDVGHRYAALAIEGRHAPTLLAAGCPLDLHPGTFGAGAATRTLLGKAEIILWRLHDAPAYRVECGHSFAPYVYAFLREAAREFA